MEKDLAFFDESKTGELVTVLEDDVDAAAEALTGKLAAGFRSVNSRYCVLPHSCTPTLSRPLPPLTPACHWPFCRRRPLSPPLQSQRISDALPA